MNPRPVIVVEGLSKKFCRDLRRSLRYGAMDIVGELTGRRVASPKLREKEFWALHDINFEIQPGSALALVGANGAGKSTLLRIISSLIKPDTGRVEIHGKVAPLIALGAGFNPILTGRENIFANMAILGLKRAEIQERLEEVIAFAEISDAIDSPVQSYSSGMAARLGFACAVFTNPNILLVDEVLAVGDMKFRAKCYRRLAYLREQGTAFVLVSHNPQVVMSLCDTALYLKRGRLEGYGKSIDVIAQYNHDLFQTSATQPMPTDIPLEKLPPDGSNSDLSIAGIEFRSPDGLRLDFPRTGMDTVLVLRCNARRQIKSGSARILIKEQGADSDWILTLNSKVDEHNLMLEAGLNEIRVSLEPLVLRPGHYSMKVAVSEGEFAILDAVETHHFSVKSELNLNQCNFLQPHRWTAWREQATRSHPLA